MHTAVREPARSARCVEHRGAMPRRDARPRARSTQQAGVHADVRRDRAATRSRPRGVGVLALLVVVLVVTVVAGFGPVRADLGEPRAVVVVEEGQTLWQLVGPHVPPGADRGTYAAAVAETNDLDPLRLRPGTVVRLP